MRGKRGGGETLTGKELFQKVKQKHQINIQTPTYKLKTTKKRKCSEKMQMREKKSAQYFFHVDY